jgi:glyceraldehyde-3-phosphate dehydrogenase (NAD(P))
MTNANIVHVVGTGTIGEPLIGMLADLKNALAIDEVTFSKRMPLLIDRSKVLSLIKRGAKLCVEKDKAADFRKIGMSPDYERYEDRVRCFVAQGSEFGFGKMYALGINDAALTQGDKYIQVVSCNTHNIAVIVRTLAIDGQCSRLVQGRFLCLRRADDISQEEGSIPSPKVDRHDDPHFGTHHARDVYWLYMHSIWFDLHLSENIDVDEAKKRFESNHRVAVTNKQLASLVFSFGRDHGYYGRILNQTVVVLPTLTVRNGKEVIGFCFTPQDGNSLLSSVAVIEHVLCHDMWEENMRKLDSYLFSEV